MQNLTTIQLIAVWILPVLFAITLHEVAHGWMALRFGDKTALMMGRLTVNPLKHIDPVGTILVPLVIFLTTKISGYPPFIFGWAKPVPVTYENLRKPKRDMAFVAVAGPLANLVMAFFWAGIAKFGVYLHGSMPNPGAALAYMGQAGIFINLILMVLNLIPIPPLDGSRIVSAILPRRLEWQYNRLERLGLVILLLLLVTGILGRIIAPAVIFLYQLILIIFGLI